MNYECYDYVNETAKRVKDIITQMGESVHIDNRREYEYELYDECLGMDYVTGNGSGSFTCDRYKAEEYLCHNWGFVTLALEDMGAEAKDYAECMDDPERADVLVRCYVLSAAINSAVTDLIESGAIVVDKEGEE